MTRRFEDGQVVRYPYLWLRQSDEGRLEAEKDRPVCVAIAVTRSDVTHLILLAITASPPASGQNFIEVPELELRRAGLSAFKRGWVAVGEYNYDVLEHSFYFDSSQRPRGAFSGRFLKALLQAVRPMLAQGGGRIDRTRP